MYERFSVKRLGAALSMALIAFLPGQAGAVIIDFEGIAPPGSLVNVNSGAPLNVGEFVFSPTNNLSAVFDSAAATSMIGNNSDFFGFAESNTISLTRSNGRLFSAFNLLIGPSTLAASLPMNMSFEGFDKSGASTGTVSVIGLTTAFSLNVPFTDLKSLRITATDDAALDNLNLQIPVPGTLALLGIGLGGLGLLRRQRLAA